MRLRNRIEKLEGESTARQPREVLVVREIVGQRPGRGWDVVRTIARGIGWRIERGAREREAHFNARIERHRKEARK
jgi:hypothetical protein